MSRRRKPLLTDAQWDRQLSSYRALFHIACLLITLNRL